MPRITRDSEEEVDAKAGRKTRLADAVSVDSPLRRSSRIKSVKHNESSPESLSSDTSNVSNTQTRVTRRRAGTMDNNAAPENRRSLRSRMNSVSSDVSEVTENDANTMTPTKKSRSSIVSDVLNKTNNQKNKRFTRAGSESKSSPARVTRNTRATSMEPESVAGNKLTDRNERTPIKTKRRTSIIPSEATVVEEKEETMKILVVSLDRTLPDVSEVKETDSSDSSKSPQKRDSVSNVEDNLDTSCCVINENSAENISENSPPKSPENVGKDISTHDNGKNKSEESKDLLMSTVTEIESSAHNLSQSFSQKADQNTSKELGLKIENLLSNSMEKHEDFSNKENLAANVINDEPNIENTDSNISLQSPKPLSVSNSNKLIKEKCKSSGNLSARNRHSRSTESMDDSTVSVVEIGSDRANNSVIEIQNTEDTDTSDNMEKLAVETDSLSGTLLNVSSDKNLSLKICSDSSSCESLELVKCVEEAVTDEDKLSETSTTAFDKEILEVHDQEKVINLTEESEKDNIKSSTDTNVQDDIKKKVNKPDTSENVQNDVEMSCINTRSSLNETNTVPLTSPDNTLTTNTKDSPISKNKEASEFGSINETNTSTPNADSVLESSKTHMSSENSKSTVADRDNVTNVVKSTLSSTVTEMPSEHTEEAPKEEGLSMSDSLTSKDQSTKKSESDEQKSESTQKTCNKNQESGGVEDDDPDMNAENLFQDIPAAEWKEKNADTDKNSIHSTSTEKIENEIEAECDLVSVDKKEVSDYMNVSKDASTIENDVDTGNVPTNAKDSMDDAENENQNKSMVEEENEHSTSKHNISKRQSAERKSLNESHKTTEIEENLSLNKSNLSKDIPVKRKSLNKSISEADVSRKSLSKSDQREKKTEKDELNNESITSASAKKSKERRFSNNSSKKQRNCIESDTESKESSVPEKHSKAAKKKFNRNRSAVRSIKSDSDDSKSNSDDSENKTIELPKFLLGEASSTDNDESDKSMDSDIEREYNLGGKDVSKFSDDDVPGDECRASETESSDPDDNGSDLADFVVDNIEEEENEEEGESEENEEEVEKVREEIEIEELHSDEDIEENQEQNEVVQVQEPDESKEGIIEKETQNEDEQINIEEVEDELIDTSSKQKRKLEISGRLSTSQIGKKKKLKKTDTSQIEKSDKENTLSDLPLSNSLKAKKKKKNRASSEFVVEDVEPPLNDSQPILNKRTQKLSTSMECSTPKSHYLPKSDAFDISINALNVSDSKINSCLDQEKTEDTSLKTKSNLKKLGKAKSKENLVDQRLSSGLMELVEKTNLSKPLSSKIAGLNKTISVPDSETPTTKYLKKEKLNESAPALKSDTTLKKLIDANSNDEQNNALNQLGKESEDVDTLTSETAQELDTLLKQKLLSVADNILAADHRKKSKKRKRTTEKSNVSITLIEDGFHEDADSQIVRKDENIVPTIEADKTEKVKEVSLNEEKKKKKKKKQKTTHTDINEDVKEALNEEITDAKSEVPKKSKKLKKKQEKGIIENIPDICSDNQVSKKKKKKISETLLNEKPTTKIPEKKRKLPKSISLQDNETEIEKLPKKKKKLVPKNASLEEVPTKKSLKKKQNLSSDDVSQDNDISIKKLSKKKHKLVENNNTGEVKSGKQTNKSQQSTDVALDSDEGPAIVKFSEAREEALQMIKRTADNIKANKEMRKKKRTERMQQRVELENEKPKFKKREIKDNKTEIPTKGIKRLPDDVLENLPDVPSKPLKKRKLLKAENQTFPSRTMFDSKDKEIEDVYVEKEFVQASSCGSTTQFAVVNMQKLKKKKKVPGIISFKQKMISRNSRQPVAAYLMYLEKQKVSGKDKFCNMPY